MVGKPPADALAANTLLVIKCQHHILSPQFKNDICANNIICCNHMSLWKFHHISFLLQTNIFLIYQRKHSLAYVLYFHWIAFQSDKAFRPSTTWISYVYVLDSNNSSSLTNSRILNIQHSIRVEIISKKFLSSLI